MHKLLMFLLTLVLSLGAITSEAANVSVVLDVPSIIYKDSACLASVNTTAFKAKFPEGSVFKTAQEGVAAAKDYRIKHYNAEMDASRHNCYMGYKKEFTNSDLMGIARDQKSDYIMFIKTYGAFEIGDVTTLIARIPLVPIPKKTTTKATKLKLYFNCKVFNAHTGAVEVEQKFDVQENAKGVLGHKLYHDNLYKAAFKKGMSTLGNPDAAKKTGIKGLLNKIK